MVPRWKPAPEGERILADRLVGDGWVRVAYSDIKAGDIFKAVNPETGDHLHAHTLLDDENAVCLATGDAIKNDPLGSTGQWYGYGIPCEFFDSLDDLRKRGSN